MVANESTSHNKISNQRKMAHPIHEANENSPYGDLTKEAFYRKHHILHQETFMLNQQNMKIFTQSWQPSTKPSHGLRGLVGMIHGYTQESGWINELNAVAIAKNGFVVYALDLQGHGASQGPPDHVTDVQPLLNDCKQYFDSVRAYHPMLPHFLFGESLGGAISILLCIEQKQAWKGLILSGPMCKISNKFKMWPLDKLLPIATFVAPSWRIAIVSPPMRRSIREKWKVKMIERSPNRKTSGKPTPASALAFFKVCGKVKRHWVELDVPVLILHGGDDVICDPEGSKHLFESIASKDKTLKIFPGMWHQLIGEPNESVEEVFNITLSWIEARADTSK